MRRSGLVVAIAVACALWAPANASAADPVVSPDGGVDYQQGTVALSATAPPTTIELELWVGEALVETRAASSVKTVRFAPYRLAARQAFKVVGRGEMGTPDGSATVVLDPADYRPLKPVLWNTRASMVVASSWTFKGTAYLPITELRVYVRQTRSRKTYLQSADSTGTFAFTVAVPYSVARTREIVAVNGFGQSPAKLRRVFYLGTSLPKTRRYVFISKKTCWMFHVYGGQVLRQWPVAIGTHRTPTRTGTFKIGRPQSGGGSWGVLRRRLWRYRNGKTYKTNYFIHGTNDPNSIGMMASHGCVRMHNKHVREFAKKVPKNTIIRIR